MGVDVDFDGGIHSDHAKAADDLGRVGDLLGAEEELGVVVLPLEQEEEDCQSVYHRHVALSERNAGLPHRRSA